MSAEPHAEAPDALPDAAQALQSTLDALGPASTIAEIHAAADRSGAVVFMVAVDRDLAGEFDDALRAAMGMMAERRRRTVDALLRAKPAGGVQ